MSKLEPIGVVDIGSNSIRFVIFDGAVRSPTVIFNEKVSCGLGRTVLTTGRLAESAVARALRALKRFHAIARNKEIKYLRAIATAAVRDAANGREFIAAARSALGAPIQILTGEQEATFAAHGIALGFGAVEGIAGDLGGGSLELIDVKGSKLNNAITLPLGGLSLIDTSGSKIERASEQADRVIGGIDWLKQARGRTFYAVGGTWRALAKLYMAGENYPLRVMHGYAIPAAEAIEFCEAIRRKRTNSLEGLEGLTRQRREVLPYGALVLERMLKAMDAREVVFSTYGIREGLLYRLLSDHERQRDPLISFCETYARANGASYETVRELPAWTDPIFADPAHKETPEERRLRHAACLLSELGRKASPDYRAEEGFNEIVKSTLCGVDHPGRVFLGFAVYFRSMDTVGEEEDELPRKLKKLIDRRAMKRAKVLGAAIRVAHVLSIGRPRVIDEITLSYERGKIVLSLPKVHAELAGERLERRFQTLAQLLDREALIRVA